MSYAQMKAFHAVVEEGSVQGAAARLRLTQPAISQHLRKLEQDSGKALLRRSGHRFKPTDEGDILYAIVDRMVRAERDAEAILRPGAGASRGTIRIGADGPHTALLLVERFRAREPSVRVELQMGNAEETWRDLLDLRTDVAVLAGAPESDRVQRLAARRQSLVALFPAAHPLAEHRKVTLEHLVDEPLIFREQGSSTQARLLRGIEERGIDVAPALVLGSREAVVLAVSRGMGIGFAYDGELGPASGIAAVPVEGFTDANTDEVVCVREQRDNPLVATFLDNV